MKVYELPDEIPDSVVIGRLAHYGRVISFRRDRVADAIFNGVRTARMLIQKPIPAQSFIAGEFVRFWYPNQPKTCRKCGSEDHLAATCKSQRCFNCERPGHRAEQCDMPALCRVCLADGHETTNCPYIYYSSNITSAKPTDKATGEPTDKPASKPTLSYSGAARAGKVAAAAREVEENISQTKRDEDKRARREELARKEKDRERKEKDRKEKERREERERREEKEQKEKDRKEKERKEKERRERREKEREERDYEDRRERDKRRDKHHERGHKENDDYRRGRDDRERDRDRYRSSRDLSRDRSSHRHYEHSDSEESDGWTRVSHRKSKSY